MGILKEKTFLLLGLKRLQARAAVIRTNLRIMFTINLLILSLCLQESEIKIYMVIFCENIKDNHKYTHNLLSHSIYVSGIIVCIKPVFPTESTLSRKLHYK